MAEAATDVLAPGGDSKPLSKGQYTAELSGIVGKIKGKVAEEESLGPAPELKPVPPPNVQSTDWKTQWSSAAMLLAVIGSLATRRPLVSAMKAVSAGLEGFRKGDQAAVDQAWQSYKVASENAIKVFDAETKRYNAIIEKNKNDVNSLKAELTAAAAAQNDPAMLDLLRTRTAVEAATLIEKRVKLRSEMADADVKASEEMSVHAAMVELEKSPKYQAANKLQQAKMKADLLAEVSPKNSEISAKTKEAVNKAAMKLKPQIDAMGATIKDIDVATAMLDKDPWLAGVAGKARYYGEAALALIHPRQKAPAHAFLSIITKIQADVQGISRNHYMSHTAIERLNDQIQGLGLFDSAASAQDSLGRLRDSLSDESNQLNDLIEQKGERAGAAAGQAYDQPEGASSDQDDSDIEPLIKKYLPDGTNSGN